MQRLLARWTMITVVAAAMLVPAMAVADGPTAQPPDAFSQNKRLGRGVNILGYDPIWKDRQKARFQEKYFRLIKEAGFDNVRINLHPFRDGKLGTDYKPSGAWFDTLDWAIQHALANRLMVILDFHEFHALGDDPAGNKERFLAVWRQIAEHCKNAQTRCCSRFSTSRIRSLRPSCGTPCSARRWRLCGGPTRAAR